MSLQGVEELNANLMLVKNWTDVSLKAAMEKSLNLIEVSAKAEHLRAKSLSPAGIKDHQEERYLTWTGDLTGSIHSEGAKATLTGLSGIVSASESYAERVELGSAKSRAFPFMQPALDDNGDEIIGILGQAVSKVIK